MSDEFFPLLEGEEVLTDRAEFFFRQCPGHLVDAEPSALMFSESSADGGKLSGARSSLTTSRDAYEQRAASSRDSARPATLGTFGLTVDDIDHVAETTRSPLRAVDDSRISPPGTPPGHTYLDQRHLGSRPSNPDKRRVRAALYIAAMKHGRLWPGA